MLRSIFGIISVLLLVALLFSSVPAQSLIDNRDFRYTHGMEFLRSSLPADAERSYHDRSWAEGTWTFCFRMPLKEGLTHVGEIPVIWYDNASGYDVPDRKLVFASPYLALEFGYPGNTRTEIGMRFPTAENPGSAQLHGASIDPMRLDAHVRDAYSLLVSQYRRLGNGSVSPTLLGAVVGTIKTFGFDDSAIYGKLSVGLDIRANAVHLCAGVRSIGLIAGEHEFGQRDKHELYATTRIRIINMYPVLQVRIPLDKERRETLSHILGFAVVIDLAELL